jgi:hypothetical protein
MLCPTHKRTIGGRRFKFPNVVYCSKKEEFCFFAATMQATGSLPTTDGRLLPKKMFAVLEQLDALHR